jgi:hypothetical protein
MNDSKISVYIGMRSATKVLWFLYLHLGPQSATPWSKILQLTIEIFISSKKCEIKLPGRWGGRSKGENGGRRGRKDNT